MTRILQLLLLLTLLGLTPALSAQVIRLQKQATVDPHQDVRLGDIATISGADRRAAEDLSNTIIVPEIDTSRTLRAESVLLALVPQRGPASTNNLQLAGSARCVITVGRSQPAADKAATTPVLTASVLPAPASPAAVTPVAATAIQPSVPQGPSDNLPLSKLIPLKLQQDLSLPADDLRVSINTINPLLDAPVAAGRKWLFRPLTRSLLGTVQFEAQLVEGSRTIDHLTVQTKVERRQMAVFATGNIARGDVITSGMIRLEETWLDRKLPTLFSTDKEILGLEAQRAIEIGSMLDQRDFKPAVMASKGDAVTVFYLSGPLKVQMRGRAMEEGKLHDQVDIRNEMTGERYQAVLIGRRLAVVGGTLSEAEEQKLRETR